MALSGNVVSPGEPSPTPIGRGSSSSGGSASTNPLHLDIESGQQAKKSQVPEMERQGSTAFSDEKSFPFEIRTTSLEYDVGINKTTKTVLKGIDALFSAGELTALMGPSGAGKSTLLNVLAANNQRPYRGDIRVNGEPVMSGFRNVCVTIPQADVCYPALTGRQTLWYSALLRLPSSISKAKKKIIVEELLEELNLTHCADTLVGNEDIRGMSGGERKRVSIGNELVVNPSVLFVDEPTSGLDSSAAENLVESLGRLAHKYSRTVICTIHQPSWQVFQKFDKMLLMHKGRVAYHGEARVQLVNYFTTIGYACPAQENPLDFFMRELQAVDDHVFPDMWDKFEDKAQFKTVKELEGNVPKLDIEALGKWKHVNSPLQQYLILLQRTGHDTVRDKTKMFGGFAQKLMVYLLMGIVFIGQAGDTNDTIFTTQGPLFFLVFLAGMDSIMKNVLEFPAIKSLIAREYKNNAYGMVPYFLAQATVTFGLEALNATLAFPAYFLIGLRIEASRALTYYAVMMTTAWIGSALGLWIGSMAKDMKEAQGFIMPIIMPMMLFSGFVIPLASIQFYFVWLYHISFFQYGLSIMLANEFEGKSFTDCDRAAEIANNVSSSNLCYETGDQYLEFAEINPDDIPTYFGYLYAFIFFFLVIGCATSRYQIKKASQTG